MAKRRHFRASHALEVTGRGPVTVRIVKDMATGKDEATMELGVDYTKAEVPERFYYADYCDVQPSRSGYSLIFAKLALGNSKLRTKIEVIFPKVMFVRQLWGISRSFEETVRQATKSEDFPAIGKVEDTEKVQTFRSNNVFMGMWGEESLMDFYYLSPRDIHFARQKQTQEVGLEPVVRVIMPTALMVEFLEKCRPYAEKLSEVSVPGAGAN